MFADLRDSYLRCISKRSILCILVSSTPPYTSIITPQKLKKGAPVIISNRRYKNNQNSLRRFEENFGMAQYVADYKLKRETKILKRSVLNSQIVKKYPITEYVSANARSMPMQTTLTSGNESTTTRDYPISSRLTPSNTRNLPATIAISIGVNRETETGDRNRMLRELSVL
ncbi:uncharacterized protein LOC115219683 [Octopus sinensis]|uniref:Uncharacterized protein LOC115219683 n=1 Tax=Octopus sinensis TaxID=2607531 RepID=A0A6P7T638_9MOLL|nr:uncharacterized protein LOC115219683 [Octopus sinensis]